MKKQCGNMIYNDFLDCWMVYWDDVKNDYPIRCGDTFDLYLGERMHLPCRMELGRDWYIIVGDNDTKFDLKPNETYKIYL